MQKRENVRRRRRGRRRPLIGIALAALAATAATNGQAPAGTVWLRGRGDALVPGEAFHPSDHPCTAPCIVMATSGARPYGLEDCTSASIILGFRAPRWGVIFDWDILTHPLYREDRLRVDCRAATSRGGVLLSVKAGRARRGIAGFSSEGEYTCAVSCACVPIKGARFGIEWDVAPADARESTAVTAAVSVSAGGCRLTANRSIDSPSGGGARIGIELEVGGGVSLLAGYRTRSDEITAGIVCRTECYLVGMSWSDHASLGATLTVGLGRVWRI